MSDRSKKSDYVISCIIFSLVIIIMVLFPMVKQHYYYIGNDAIGYFGIAASILKKNWYDILSTVDTFSYGYGIILVPTFLLARIPGGVLVGAAVINTILLYISFVFYYFSARKIFGKNQSLFIAMSVTLYSGNLSASRIFGADILLTSIFSVLFFVLLEYLDGCKWIYGLMLILVSVLCYCAHQRAIIIPFVVMCLLFLLTLTKKIKISNFVCFLLFMLLIFTVARIGYKHSGNIFSTIESSQVIDVNSEKTRIKWILEEIGTLFFWKRTITNFARQLLYISISSLGLGLIPIVFFWGRLIESVKTKKISNVVLVEGFISAIVILQTLMISVSLNPTKVSHLGMGRYIDYFIPVLLILTYSEVIVYQNDLWICRNFGLIISVITILGAFCYYFGLNSLQSLEVSGHENFIGESWIEDIKINIISVSLIVSLFSYYLSSKLKTNAKLNARMILIVTSLYYLFCYAEPFYTSIRKDISKKEEGYQMVGYSLKDNNIKTLYWPYQINTLEMRHFQVYCTNLDVKYYVYSNQKYDGNEQELFFDNEEMIQEHDNAAYVISNEEIRMKINSEYDTRIIGKISGYDIVMIE